MNTQLGTSIHQIQLCYYSDCFCTARSAFCAACSISVLCISTLAGTTARMIVRSCCICRLTICRILEIILWSSISSTVRTSPGESVSVRLGRLGPLIADLSDKRKKNAHGILEDEWTNACCPKSFDTKPEVASKRQRVFGYKLNVQKIRCPT